MKRHKFRDLASSEFEPKAWAPWPMFLFYLCKESVFRQEKERQQPQRLFAALFPWLPTLSLEALVQP